MTHLSLHDQDLAEEQYKLSLQQIRQIMDNTHRFMRFLNNSAETWISPQQVVCQNDHPMRHPIALGFCGA